jgi:hypothetical protein
MTVRNLGKRSSDLPSVPARLSPFYLALFRGQNRALSTRRTDQKAEGCNPGVVPYPKDDICWFCSEHPTIVAPFVL